MWGMKPFESLTKPELHQLADRLVVGDPEAIEYCIAFIESDTFGLWHGRARAMMARRLKHCELTDRQRNRLIRAILQRLTSGQFSEQFKDQLQLVLYLDPSKAFEAARQLQSDSLSHLRRYATWILLHEAGPSSADPPNSKPSD